MAKTKSGSLLLKAFNRPEGYLVGVFAGLILIGAVLLTLPGLFSTVEKGYDDLLDREEARKALAKHYGRYVLGLNMPTVFHSVVQNADELHKILAGKLRHKPCTVLARSRGGLVARYLFEKTWINNNNNEPRLCCIPHKDP